MHGLEAVSLGNFSCIVSSSGKYSMLEGESFRAIARTREILSKIEYGRGH